MKRPPVKWSQTTEHVRVAVDVPGIARVDASAAEGGLRVQCWADAGEQPVVDVVLGLYGEATVVSAVAEPLGAVVLLRKHEHAFWPRLTAGPHSLATASIAVDWSRYAPEPGRDYDDDDIMAVDI